MVIKIVLFTFTCVCARSIYSNINIEGHKQTYASNQKPTNEYSELALPRSARDLIGYNHLRNIASNVNLSSKGIRRLRTYKTQIAKYIEKNANKDILKRFKAIEIARRSSRRIQILKNSGYA